MSNCDSSSTEQERIDHTVVCGVFIKRENKTWKNTQNSFFSLDMRT